MYSPSLLIMSTALSEHVVSYNSCNLRMAVCMIRYDIYIICSCFILVMYLSKTLISYGTIIE